MQSKLYSFLIFMQFVRGICIHKEPLFPSINISFPITNLPHVCVFVNRNGSLKKTFLGSKMNFSKILQKIKQTLWNFKCIIFLNMSSAVKELILNNRDYFNAVEPQFCDVVLIQCLQMAFTYSINSVTQHFRECALLDGPWVLSPPLIVCDLDFPLVTGS